MTVTIPRRPKGLVSFSLLKSLFDEHQDHLQMFVPILLDALRAFPADHFSTDDMVQHIAKTTRLRLPTGTMEALLARARRLNCIRRDGGRFFINRAEVGKHDLRERLAIAVDHETRLAMALLDWARDRKVVLPDTESALDLIIAFLEHNQTALLLDPTGTALLEPPDSIGEREARLVARFILERCIPDGELSACLGSMLEGYVLQNTLLLREFGVASRHFRNLTVYFDTGFLFAVLGIRGPAAALSARDTLQLVAGLDAKLGVFSATIGEMRRILSVYENCLGTSDGQRKLHPREETRYFITNHYSPSMVRELSTFLERDLAEVGISVRELPTHEREFTLDESDLSRRLMRPQDDFEDARIVTDVDSVAAVLTLRRGHRSNSLDSARAVFATTTGLVVKHVNEWYRGQGEGGISPVMHVSALTSIAWLRKPAAAQDAKIHELIALCVASIRPSRKVWGRFVSYLQKAQDDRRLSSDETIAILASEFTDSKLSEVSDVSEDVDATTISEVVERVKAHYRQDADAKVSVAQGDADTARQALFVTAAELAEQRRRTELLVLAVRGKALRVGALVSRLVYWGLAPVLVYVSVASTFSRFRPNTRLTQQVFGPLSVAILILGVAGLLWGTHLSQIRIKLASVIARWVDKSFLKDHVVAPEASGTDRGDDA